MLFGIPLYKDGGPNPEPYAQGFLATAVSSSF